jgi:hypothetical protein
MIDTAQLNVEGLFWGWKFMTFQQIVQTYLEALKILPKVQLIQTVTFMPVN